MPTFDELRERSEEILKRRLRSFRVVTDTTEFMDLNSGDVVELGGRFFLVRGNTYEGRFGLSDEPKHWVKRAVELMDGEPKILKLVFLEEFLLPIGGLTVRCFRSPHKESRILEIVAEHPLFMHGQTIPDSAGNPVRVLDLVRGRPLDAHLSDLGGGHRDYFAQRLRRVLERLAELFEAIAWLHRQGDVHGDIRRDHIFVENNGGLWRWIDFDYNYQLKENPYGLDLFGLGNVLLYAVARADVNRHWLEQYDPAALARLSPGDFSPVIKSRLVNLRAVFGYLPERLGLVLMHFAQSAPVFYERVEELVDDLMPAIEDLPAGDPEMKP